MTRKVLAVWLTIPYVLPLVGGSWALSFGVWAIPVYLTAALMPPRQSTTVPKVSNTSAFTGTPAA